MTYRHTWMGGRVCQRIHFSSFLGHSSGHVSGAFLQATSIEMAALLALGRVANAVTAPTTSAASGLATSAMAVQARTDGRYMDELCWRFLLAHTVLARISVGVRNGWAQ